MDLFAAVLFPRCQDFLFFLLSFSFKAKANWTGKSVRRPCADVANKIIGLISLINPIWLFLFSFFYDKVFPIVCNPMKSVGCKSVGSCWLFFLFKPLLFWRSRWPCQLTGTMHMCRAGNAWDRYNNVLVVDDEIIMRNTKFILSPP